ncbi:hypothetical protein LPJGGPFB_02537 [Ensifer adhaerens]|uniref:hypothetical protein n=1 Tax=Ensifer adhaerens TaxID=106592 RepID=UPI00156891AD|nr:hypothetical protein [Ensifer adhaerens]NRP19282.1 hypothetical protein [Ensifer adhaerens]
MFNLLVAGSPTWWETSRFSIGVDRFKEHSDPIAAQVDLDRPETLAILEQIPTLLMYEVGANGQHVRTVRHGRVHNITRVGRELDFEFLLDADRSYLDRSDVLRFSSELGIAPFEQHRTHWAIKAASLPAQLLDLARSEPVRRTVKIVAGDYTAAIRDKQQAEVRALRLELEQFPQSLEKALALIPSRLARTATPEHYPIIGVEPKTSEGRNALLAVMARELQDEELPDTWCFSLAWFLDVYGSPTEGHQLEAAVRQCASHMIALGGADADQVLLIEKIGFVLWRSARSPALVGRLRREIAMLMDRLLSLQTIGGWWADEHDDQTLTTIRGTALAVVSLQRLGDDRYHDAIKKACQWLATQGLSNGALPRFCEYGTPDLIATTLAMEALRRSDLLADLPHVLDAGDGWLMSMQTDDGHWESQDWTPDFTTSVVLDYLARQSEMLSQVDGFLLMARDFFRKAEELRIEGGANNRRLAAISTVHAVEMFLYGLFERRDDLGLSAFKENGQETLGPREALRVLQDALVRIGVIAPPRTLFRRDKLSSLIGRRDGIIHRAFEISEAELMDGIRHSRAFINEYSKSLLKLDLLQ